MLVKQGVKLREQIKRLNKWSVSLNHRQTLVSRSPIEEPCPRVGSHKTEGKGLERLGRRHSQAFEVRTAKGAVNPFANADVSIQSLMSKSCRGLQSQAGLASQ